MTPCDWWLQCVGPVVVLSLRRTAADGSRSRRSGRATEGRIPSCAAQRPGGGLLPARSRAVLRPGGGGGVARALGAPRVRDPAAGPVYPDCRAARADGRAPPAYAAAVA